MTDSAPARFVARNTLGLVLSAACLVWLSRNGTMDFAVTRLFAAVGTGGFPLRDDPLWAVGGHTGLRWLAVIIWISAVVLSAISPVARVLSEWRRPLVFFSVTVAVTAALVALLKKASAHSCPWDLDMFGGTAHWFPLLEDPGAAGGPGHCWPGGHAAGGFSLLAGYFALRDDHPAFAHIAFGAALCLGSTMSLVQIVRGAHFLSHNLWTLWLTWLVCAVTYVIWQQSRAVQIFGRQTR